MESKIVNVTEEELMNYERVHPFVKEVYDYNLGVRKGKSEIKYSNKIKNSLINIILNNRDLFDYEFLDTNTDLRFVSDLNINIIMESDIINVFKYLVDKYCTDAIIKEYFTRELNLILYRVLNKYDIDYTKLYLYFRNKSMIKESLIDKTYPAKLIKLLKRFKMLFNEHCWKSFYLEDFVVMDIMQYIYLSINIDNEFDKFNNLLSNATSHLEYTDSIDCKGKSFDVLCDEEKSNELKKKYKNGVLAFEVVDRKPVVETVNNVFLHTKLLEFGYLVNDDAIVATLDDYYINNFYKSFKYHFKISHDIKFTVAILNNYRNMIPDLDKVNNYIKRDEVKNLFKLFIDGSIDNADAIPSVFYSINTYLVNDVLNYYANKAKEADLTYIDIRDFLI